MRKTISVTKGKNLYDHDQSSDTINVKSLEQVEEGHHRNCKVWGQQESLGDIETKRFLHTNLDEYLNKKKKEVTCISCLNCMKKDN